MTNRAFALRIRFISMLCAGLFVFACGVVSSALAATQISPTLISTSTTTRAIALESVTMHSEPFSLASEGNFNAGDPRTRIEIFCMNLDFLAGEISTSGNILVGDPNALTVDAEDAAHNHYPLKVEYVAQVPPLLDSQGNITTDFRGLYMVIVRLNDSMTSNLGDVLIRLNLHGMSSNRVRFAIGAIGGGPADDAGAVPTPAPATPPTPILNPQTIAQFQAQFTNPSIAAGPDGIRFLEQTTWGPTDSDLTHLRSVGMQAYLNEQFNTPPQFVDAPNNISSNYPLTTLYPINQPSPCDANCVRDNYTLYPLQNQFVTSAVTRPDQLRQRVSFAVHQFIVVAGRDMNNNEASWYAPYLQTIDRNSFGNFRTMLFDITLNPGMGHYLDMAGNSRVAPNENYAREVMQLFSIGTDMLNQNGTPILDANGNRVPTYGQTEITNFARVFTGWVIPQTNINTFGGATVPDYIRPMGFSNNTAANGPFDIGAKTLLGGQQLPACGICTNNAPNMATYKNAELNAAIDNLFNHQNTAPYVCTQLIHQLVTSNPSPAYVGRCAAAFANNGSGTRGDMKAVITSILLDPEARGDVKTDPNYGHLREPILLMTDLLRAFNATSDGVLTTNVSGAGSFTTPLGQDQFNPPTVFSYFPASFGVPGTSLIGPEFGILDTSTTYQRANFVNTLFLANSGNGIAANVPNRPTGTQLNYSSYQAMAANCTGVATCQLVDALNTNMMHGTMSSSMRTSIINAVTGISSADPAGRTRTAIYLVATSSQYQVER
ncbi:MAG TPA: DUF1800 domain-containing protein [Pyrinomonadaceae bacterium]|nr:DUF1800 domain-containing protein [Pyrinomonadaceae bacterium]